jgi:dethiobiotin synthase
MGSDTCPTPWEASYPIVRYWKPIQTGIEQDDDTAEVRRLGGCAANEILGRGIRLERPLSPHLSARLSGLRISIDDAMRQAGADLDAGTWIVEGAGGALVPINESEMMIDLMVRLALPVVVVSRTALGTINHTLLTLEALRARALRVAGVLLSGAPNAENRNAIEQYGGVRVVGVMPRFEPLTPEAVRDWARADLDVPELS